VAELGKHVITMTTEAGSGHPSSALSIGHLVVSLMYNQMRFDPANPWDARNDRLVLSEGHAVPAVYAAYADLGGAVGFSPDKPRTLSTEDLATLRDLNSVLDGHPNPAEGFPFFDAATGSLGQGISVAGGLGLAAHMAGSDKRIFVLVGDGESREGQIWEALDFLVDHRLSNVITIFNCNGQGQADYVSKQQSAETLEAKLEAFGCRVAVVDGHDADQIDHALSTSSDADTPLAVVARTEKGWGVSSLKDKSNHGKPLPADKVAAACAELDAIAAKLPANGEKMQPRSHDGPADAPGAPKPITLPAYSAALEQAGMSGVTKVATRRAYGAALLALGHADPRIVAVDGDVSNSTFANVFAKAFPERFFECKIAEQNMVSVAAGLATGGLIPFASTFAKFFARAYDQIEMAHITRANIKLVGSHAGVSLAADGPSQMGTLDVGYFRLFSNVDDGTGAPAGVSFEPADGIAAYRLTELMANHRGMCYMRTHRPDVPLLYDEQTKFAIGGSHRVRDGGDATIVSAGYMVHVALAAAEKLEAAGVQCAVVDAYSFPLDCDPILEAAANAGGVIVAVEDNYGGGVTSALAEAAARAGRVTVHPAICKRIPKSGKSPEDVLVQD
jgi:transketolase